MEVQNIGAYLRQRYLCLISNTYRTYNAHYYYWATSIACWKHVKLEQIHSTTWNFVEALKDFYTGHKEHCKITVQVGAASRPSSALSNVCSTNVHMLQNVVPGLHECFRKLRGFWKRDTKQHCNHPDAKKYHNAH